MHLILHGWRVLLACRCRKNFLLFLGIMFIRLSVLVHVRYTKVLQHIAYLGRGDTRPTPSFWIVRVGEGLLPWWGTAICEGRSQHYRCLGLIAIIRF